MAISLVIGVAGAAGAYALGASALLIGGAFLVGAALGSYVMDGIDVGAAGGIAGTNATVREPSVSRKIIYGTARTGGAVVFLDSSGDENKYLHLVIAFAGHEIESYEAIYFDDKLVWGDETSAHSNPFTTASGSSTVQFAYTGTANAGDTITLSGATAVGGLTLNGTYTIASVEANYFTFNAGSNATSAATGGGTVTMVRRGYQGSWKNYAELNFYKGDQTTADSNLVSRSTKWDSNNKLLDTAYIYARLVFDSENLSGVPNISAVIKGKKVHNPVTNLTEFTSNPALCVRDYLLDSKYGLGEVSSSIDSTTLSTAISLCDENVALSAGGTEKRYSLNGIVDTARSRKSNINSMMRCMSGKLVYSSDKYYIIAGGYSTPVMTIDESLLAGDVQIRTKQSRRQLYNGVKGTYVSAENNYIVSDYPAQISSSYETADGEPIYMDLQLPFVTTNTHAQRLAKIALLQSRQQQNITLPCNLAALKFKAGDNIQVTYEKMGYSNKVFEVVNYTIALQKNGSIVVNVEAIETASDIWDWNTSDEEDFLAAGQIDLYDGTTAEPPTSLSLAKSTSINDDGTALEDIVATWTASADVFVDKYEIEWSTDNTVYTGVVTDSTRFTINNVIAAQTYYVRVRGVNNLGVKSTYATANITATGDTTAPAVPTNLSATAGYQQIRLNWTNPSDKDFSHVVIQRRTSGGTFSAIASVAGGRGEAGEFVSAGLDDQTQYFHRIKSEDYSGNASSFVTAVSATTEAAPEAPRAENGYIYLTAASSSQPATPTATSYNYNTNTFSGLTSGWQVDPPAVDASEDKYWAASFTITEATHGGTQTITFSTPFVSHFFDGLVTFTSLNTEIADAGSSRITTINGGLIKTGTVDASRLRIDNVGIDTFTSQGQTFLRLGDDGVTTVKIDNLAVTGAKIANLAVDTIKIADQAVTIPSGAYTAGDFFSSQYYDNGNIDRQNVQSVAFTATANVPTEIFWSFFGFLDTGDDDAGDFGYAKIYVRIKRGSTVVVDYGDIYTLTGTDLRRTGMVNGSFVHTPTSGGSVTYHLEIGRQGDEIQVSKRSLITTELKK